jgi:hypothetical protein
MMLALLSLSLVCNPWLPTKGNRAFVTATLSFRAKQSRLTPISGIGNDESGEPSSPLPQVLLSIEPAGTAADLGSEISVVFPGYLLPDDNHEDPAHEGS